MDSFFIFSAKYLFILPALMLGTYFFVQKWPTQKRMALFAIPAGLFAYVLGLIAGYLYYDPRPFVVEHFTPLVSHAANNGFPSDHTLLVSAFAMVALYWNRTLGVVLWVLAITVAVARVYVGVHHPLDVIGSIVLGAVGVSVVYWFFTRVLRQGIS
jgi:undecaprenyl-diphosphatase